MGSARESSVKLTIGSVIGSITLHMSCLTSYRMASDFNKENDGKYNNWLENILVPNLPSKNKYLTLTVTNYTKADIKVLWF